MKTIWKVLLLVLGVAGLHLPLSFSIAYNTGSLVIGVFCFLFSSIMYWLLIDEYI